MYLLYGITGQICFFQAAHSKATVLYIARRIKEMQDFLFTLLYHFDQFGRPCYMLHACRIFEFGTWGKWPLRTFFFSRFLWFFLRFLKPFLRLLFMVSPLRQNDRYNCYTANIPRYWGKNILSVFWWYTNFSQNIIHQVCVLYDKRYFITYAKVSY